MDLDTFRGSQSPLTVEGAQRPQASRLLWLVKWLLALPHYIVLAFLAFFGMFAWLWALIGILLTGRRVPAAEAFDLGFVTALAPAGGAMVEARKWADQMLECAPLSLRATKEVARKTMLGDDFESKLMAAREFPAAKRLRSSEDYKEGPRAFAEKRKPQWKNR